MDLDAMHRHVIELRKFKDRIEALLSGSAPDATGPADILRGQINDLHGQLDDFGKRMDELGEHIATLQVSADAEKALSDRLLAMLTWFEANQDGLELLLSLGEEKDTTGGTAPDSSSGTAASAPAGGTGAVSGAAGTADPAAATPAPAAPLTGTTDAPVPQTN